MNQFASRIGENPMRYAKKTFFTTIGVGAASAAIWAVVFLIMADSRGDYAGQHYTEARAEAIDVMAYQYGAELAGRLRLGTPDVVNTHIKDSATIGAGQVRIFNLIGPAGVHYCVPLWSRAPYWREAKAVVKGCILSPSGAYRSTGQFPAIPVAHKKKS